MSTTTAPEFKVGDKLWFVPRIQHRTPEFVTITKVGRKWLTVTTSNLWKEYRVNVETLEVDGGSYSSPGRCHRSKDDYEASCQLDKAFSMLRNAMGNSPRDGVTIDDIREAARLLRIPLEGT